MATRLSELRAQVDPVLSTFARGFQPGARFIARQVAPIVPVTAEKGTIATFGKEGFKIYNTERALRANPKQIDLAVGSDTYVCSEYALETSLDYRELEEAQIVGAEQVIALERRSINMLQSSLEVDLEKQVADILFSGTYYASGYDVTLSGNDQWKVAGGAQGSTSTPIADIKTGLTAARAGMGVYPNTIVFGALAWDAFTEHSDVLDRIKHTQTGVVTEQLAAQLLGVERVLVGKGVYANASDAFVDIWGDNVALIYTPENSMMAEGTTPHTAIFEKLGYPKVMTHDNKYTRDYAVQRVHAVKNIATTYGYLIIDTNA